MIEPGHIEEAIARRSVGKETILVNVPEEKTNAGLKVTNEAGYNVSVTVGGRHLA